MNRFVMTVQTLALPTLAFDPFLSYTPSWQEVASFLAVVAYGVILYSLSFRYLNLFPQERELAPSRRPDMFPWSPEFVWDAYHVAFFGALYSVLATMAGTLAVAAWRARRDARDGPGGRRSPGTATSRRCRPRPAPAATSSPGEAPGRVVRERLRLPRLRASTPGFEALRQEVGRPASADPAVHFGFELPLDRLYHRGHTWVRPETDGTLTVGLDDIARRLLGTPEKVELPGAGRAARR